MSSVCVRGYVCLYVQVCVYVYVQWGGSLFMCVIQVSRWSICVHASVCVCVHPGGV